MYMRVHRFHPMAETSMNKRLAGEGGYEIRVKLLALSFTIQISMYKSEVYGIFDKELIVNLSSISS